MAAGLTKLVAVAAIKAAAVAEGVVEAAANGEEEPEPPPDPKPKPKARSRPTRRAAPRSDAG